MILCDKSQPTDAAMAILLLLGLHNAIHLVRIDTHMPNSLHGFA